MITYSPWLRFYQCPVCNAAGESSELYDRSGPCPTCGSQVTQKVGRWRIETEQWGFFKELLLGLVALTPKQTFTAEMKDTTT